MGAMLIRLTLLTAVASSLLLASAAGAATPYSPPSGLAHSRVATYDRGVVRIEALQAAVTRTGGHLNVIATVKVKNLTSARVTRFVRAGRCVRGSLAAPACKAEALFSVSVAGGGEATVVRKLTLRQPPSKVDAIELSVQASRRQPAYFSRSDGELLLRGNAWRGVGAGATYGAAFPAGDDRAKRLSFDLPASIDGTSAYADLVWTGIAAPAAPTTLGKCNTLTDCTTSPLTPSRFRTGPQHFGNRFHLRNEGHAAITLSVADTDGTPLLTAALPWPAKV
jgi:hypothetical protein